MMTDKTPAERYAEISGKLRDREPAKWVQVQIQDAFLLSKITWAHTRIDQLTEIVEQQVAS